MRARSIFISVLVAIVIVGANAGSGQDKWACKWVPTEYNQRYQPRMIDWMVLTMTARFNCTAGLTDKIVRQGFTAYAWPETLSVIVNTRCQPDWPYHIGGGKFSVSDRELRLAYDEAGEAVLREITAILGHEIDESAVVIRFAIRGSLVGTWHNGAMRLGGEVSPGKPE